MKRPSNINHGDASMPHALSRRPTRKRLLFAAAGALAGFVAAPAVPARAQSVADFYKGRDLRLIISSTVGGGYDVYARTIARHLGRHIPGNPTIVPQNMPGAGGIAAANHIHAIAPKDGSVIAALQNTVPLEPFFENKAAVFDAAKLSWLGTPASETGMYIVWHSSKIGSVRDAQTQTFIAGAAGAASTPAFYGRVFNQVLRLKARLVSGYPGQNEILLAMENGEVEAMPSPFWSSLKTARPNWYPQGMIRVLFQYGAAAHPELKGVPFALDLIDNPTDKILLTAASAPLALGRPYAAPPGVPADRLAALRAAMRATFTDAAFLADCERQRLECNDHHSGAELEALIRQAYATPDDIRKRLVAIQQQGQTEDRK
jgi:tripartite-type tricarboxylate transporter receptor subunit TctC